MRILITGGSGFIGQALCPHLIEHGHDLGVVSRNPKHALKKLPAGVDVRNSVAAFADFEAEAIINLAGEPIAQKRWSASRKQQLVSSRVDITRSLTELISHQKLAPKVLISASAVGYYGPCGAEPVTESRVQGHDFSAELCAQWEAAALEASPWVDRVCLLRIGLVFDQPGGMLDRILPPFKFGFGAPMGSGKHYMPWIHRHDVVRAIEYVLTHDQLSGPINLSAPEPVDNLTFSKTLARVLHRPMFMRLPEPMLRVMFGEMADLLVTGARMVPEQLLASGFKFDYPQLDRALAQIVETT